jgi:hypothetical protein
MATSGVISLDGVDANFEFVEHVVFESGDGPDLKGYSCTYLDFMCFSARMLVLPDRPWRSSMSRLAIYAREAVAGA